MLRRIFPRGSAVACSQAVYFLFKVRRARVIKNNNPGGLNDGQRKGVVVGEEQNIIFSFSRSALEMKEKRNKTSVYRLAPPPRK